MNSLILYFLYFLFCMLIFVSLYLASFYLFPSTILPVCFSENSVRLLCWSQASFPWVIFHPLTWPYLVVVASSFPFAPVPERTHLHPTFDLIISDPVGLRDLLYTSFSNSFPLWNIWVWSEVHVSAAYPMKSLQKLKKIHCLCQLQR